MTGDSPELDRAVDNLKRSYDKQKVINSLLQLALEDIPLEELLQHTLDLSNTIDWIALESKGSIFLVEDQPEVLVMKAQKGMTSLILEACRRIPFGRCLCGLAASTRQIQFADGLDERHTIRTEGMLPHGHYCVPILFGDRVLGVINFYVKAGHHYSPQEEEFLAAIANTLAGIIVRREAEAAQQRSEQEFRLLVENLPAIVFKGYLDGSIDLFDDKVEEMTGYPKQEFDSRALKWTDLILDEDRPEAQQEFDAALKGCKPYLREYRIRRRDRKPIWIQERSHIVCEDKGVFTYVSGVFFDISERKQGEVALKRTVEKLKQTVHATVRALTSALEMRDPYTAGHQRRVTDLACAIAKEIGFSEAKIEGMRIIGFLHDIGKIAVPAEILTKPGKISEHEFNIIKTHAEAGYNILKEIDFPCDVAKIVVQHHERLNGSGYPKGLSGSEILLEARILAVADVVEAMSSNRPYRPGLGTEAALKEITEQKGILYDPGVVDICVKLFTEKGFTFEATGCDSDRWGGDSRVNLAGPDPAPVDHNNTISSKPSRQLSQR
ncbi:MAG: HD domain-containing protein [Deltaproteobacteria bacterium]|nr:HD domain-containing protein [Deltaproteobacteria bacterium]